MARRGFSSVQGVAMRVTPLDGNGTPQTALAVVSKGFTRVQSQVQTQQTQAVTVNNAAGEICFTKPAEEQTLGTQLTIDFCKVDPELFSLDPQTVDAVTRAEGVVP